MFSRIPSSGTERGRSPGRPKPARVSSKGRPGGTIFLDEIGDLPEISQIKLLRVLQDREYFPLGSDHPRPVEARIVVATNKELKQLSEGKAFRQDLYFRLRTHHVHVPPLRQHVDDIPVLSNTIWKKRPSSSAKRSPPTLRELPQLLMTYNFPGNVRELRAMVYDAVGRHSSRVMSMDSFRNNINANRARPWSSPTEGQHLRKYGEIANNKRGE